MKKWSITLFLAVALAFSVSGMANAIPCGNGFLSGAIKCQDGWVGTNDYISPTLAVNDQSFFGETDWVFLQKGEIGDTVNEYETAEDIGLSVTVNPWAKEQNFGKWSFNASAWDMYEDIMIVLKTGGGKDVVNFSGYLLKNGVNSGIWYTGIGGKALSHLTVYGKGVSVPEPATLILLGFGLTGLGLLGRRKTRSN